MLALLRRSPRPSQWHRDPPTQFVRKEGPQRTENDPPDEPESFTRLISVPVPLKGAGRAGCHHLAKQISMPSLLYEFNQNAPFVETLIESVGFRVSPDLAAHGLYFSCSQLYSANPHWPSGSACDSEHRDVWIDTCRRLGFCLFSPQSSHSKS